MPSLIIMVEVEENAYSPGAAKQVSKVPFDLEDDALKGVFSSMVLNAKEEWELKEARESSDT